MEGRGRETGYLAVWEYYTLHREEKRHSCGPLKILLSGRDLNIHVPYISVYFKATHDVF